MIYGKHFYMYLLSLPTVYKYHDLSRDLVALLKFLTNNSLL